VPRVFVGVGSNIDRESSIRAGIRALRDSFGKLTLSQVYESPPYGFEGDNFYNLVVALDTELPPEVLTRELHRIEDCLGRDRKTPRFASRIMDLDLLLYGDMVCHVEDLDVPRRDILEHAFVLRPLAEIAGHMKHPESGKTFASLWQAFERTDQKIWPVQVTFDE